MTVRQLRRRIVTCGAVAGGGVSGGGIAVWLAGWPVRWVAEPIATLVLLVLAVAGRDVWSDVLADVGEEP